MVWIYSQEEPQRLSECRVLAMAQRTVVYNLETLSEEMEDATGYKYRYKSITLEPGVWCYDALVDALVTAEYPSSKMQAVINNYLDTPKDAEVKAEYIAMQEWRKEAKRIAKEFLSMVSDE